MIIRKRKIKSENKEISLQVSYGVPDIKKSLIQLFLKFEEAGTQTLAITAQHREQDLLHYFQHSIFAVFPSDIADSMSRWAFTQALRNNYVIQSEIDKNVFFLADSLGRRCGRPRTKSKD